MNPGVRAHSWGVIHRGGGGHPSALPSQPSAASSSSPGRWIWPPPSPGRPTCLSRSAQPRHGAELCLGFPSFGRDAWGSSRGGPREIYWDWGYPWGQGTSVGPGAICGSQECLHILGTSVGPGDIHGSQGYTHGSWGTSVGPGGHPWIRDISVGPRDIRGSQGHPWV